MTTLQIMIIILLFIEGSFFFILQQLKENSNNIIGIYIMFSISLVLLMLSLLELNKVREQINNKCPEYEKIENVYKLK